MSNTKIVRTSIVDSDGVITSHEWDPSSLEETALAENDELVVEILILEQVVKEASVRISEAKNEIIRRMTKDVSTELMTKAGLVKLNAKSTYDPKVLDKVLEYLDRDELVERGAYEPRRQVTETKERKWNMTKLRPFGKRGKVVQDVLERAKIPGTPSMKIEPR